MKIRNGIPKSDEAKNRTLLDDGWILLKEPKTILGSILYSVPLMILLCLLSVSLITLFSPFKPEEFGIQKNGLTLSINLIDIIMVLLLVLVHEILHLICIPHFIASNRTFVGLTWFGGYAYTEEILTKRRFIVIAVMPFLLISVAAAILLGTVGLLTPVLKFICILNAAASSVDFLNSILVLRQVPKKSSIAMNGQLTYYKAG